MKKKRRDIILILFFSCLSLPLRCFSKEASFFPLLFFAETAFLQFNSTREKKIKNTRTQQTDHASLKIIHFLDDDDDDDEKDARSRIKPKQIWMFFLLVLVRFVLRDARSNEREFSEIGNRVLGKSDEQFEPNRVVFGSSERAKVENACEWPEIGCECEGVDGLCKISFVSFYGMDLTGRLPRDGLPNKLESVKIFDVGNNRLRGAVTNAFVRSFPNLKSLKLGVNNLEGSIPYELGNLKWLEEIDLDGGFTERQIY